MAKPNDKLIKDLQERFKFLCKDPRVLGVVLYGSYATGEYHNMSDIDICIVAASSRTLSNI